MAAKQNKSIFNKDIVAVKSSQYFDNYIIFNDSAITNMPIVSIKTIHATDTQVRRTLAGNLLLSTFTDKPVVLNVVGFAISKKQDNCGAAKMPCIKDILKWYQANKCSAGSKSVTLSVGGVFYTCALLSLQYQSSQKAPGLLFVSMTLISNKPKI